MAWEIYKALDVGLRQQITAHLRSLASMITGSVSDDAYGSGWNGVTDVAPSKNAVYDKIEAITPNATHTGEVTGATALTVDKTAISNRSSVTISPADTLLVGDASDSNNLKKVVATNFVLNNYRPAMMRYNGASTYYQKTSIATTGNKIFLIAFIKADQQTGTGVHRIINLENGSTLISRANLVVGGATHSDTDFRNKARFAVQNSAGTVICLLFSSVDVADGDHHLIAASFDGDIGSGVLYVDGVSVDNVSATNRVAPTTGTVYNTSIDLTVGTQVASSQYFDGMIGYVGVQNAFHSTPTDFNDSDGWPVQIPNNWSVGFGSQPLAWNPHGQMTNNLGSGGNLTANGPIRLWLYGFDFSVGLDI